MGVLCCKRNYEEKVDVYCITIMIDNYLYHKYNLQSQLFVL